MLTLYNARSIITMNESLPRASAVLVRDGMIIEVGNNAIRLLSAALLQLQNKIDSGHQNSPATRP